MTSSTKIYLVTWNWLILNFIQSSSMQ